MLDLGRTLIAAIERSPHAEAIVDARRLSYAAWLADIAAAAAGLARLGLRRGDHLVLVLQNRLEMATLYWACQFAGVIATPLNWRLKPDEIDYCLAYSEAKALAFEPVAADAVAGASRVRHLPRIGIGGASGTLAFAELVAVKRPRAYVFVASVPKSPVGKILRRILVAGEYERENEEIS